MSPDAYQLKEFYKTLCGRVVGRVIDESLNKMWPSCHGLRVLGAGYAPPFLNPFEETSERTICFMFKDGGVHHWPENDSGLTTLCDETDLPLETNSIDRILLIHSLEFTGFLKPAFEEFYRVLKSNGRIIVVVPNRMGLWARADWSPFGRGTPYSSKQVELFLKENLFVPERTQRALFTPPFRHETLLRTFRFWERVGQILCPAMGGVLLVEASKQIYAGRGKLATSSKKVNLALQGKTSGAGGFSSVINPKDSLD